MSEPSDETSASARPAGEASAVPASPVPASAVPASPVPAPPRDADAELRSALERLETLDPGDLDASAEAADDVHRRLQARLRDLGTD